MATTLLNPGCDDCYDCCTNPIVTCEFVDGYGGATFNYTITDAVTASLVVTCDDPESEVDTVTTTPITLTDGAASGSVTIAAGCRSYCIIAVNTCGTTTCCKYRECDDFSDFNGYAYLCPGLHCCPQDGFIGVALDLGTLPNNGSTIITLADFDCAMVYTTYGPRVDYSTTLHHTNVKMTATTSTFGSTKYLSISFSASISWYDGSTTQTGAYTFLQAGWSNICGAYGAVAGVWAPSLYRLLDPGGSPIKEFRADLNGCDPLTSGVAYFAKLDGLPACP